MLDPKAQLANQPTTIFPFAPINDSCNTWEDVRNSNWIHGRAVLDQFRLETMEEEEESGVCSPPLWRSNTGTTTTTTTSPPRTNTAQLRYHRNLPPTSRAQAIARGQWELMEMVKNMPESSYELSLKDLVEKQQPPDSSVDEDEERSILGTKRQESKNKRLGKNMIRSGSNIDQNRGLLLNMVFPFSCVGSKKKSTKRSNSLTLGGSGAKVSPRPEYLERPAGSKHGERDWWKKKFSSVSGESESGGGTSSGSSRSTGRSGSSGSTSSSNGSRSTHSNSGRRRNGGCMPGCWNFFHSNNRK